MNNQLHQDLLKFAEQLQKPCVHYIQMRHDNSCPAILSQSHGVCNCNPTIAMSNEEESIATLVQNRKQRRAAAKVARKDSDKGPE